MSNVDKPVRPHVTVGTRKQLIDGLARTFSDPERSARILDALESTDKSEDPDLVVLAKKRSARRPVGRSRKRSHK